MAGTRFQVKTYGANIVSAHLRGLARRASDLRPAWPAVTRRVAAGYGRSFDRQGPGWQKLDPATTRRRIQEGFPPGPILRQTGSYREAATSAERLKVIESSHTLIIIVDHPLSLYHQDGTSRMPFRPLKLSAGDRYWLVWEINQSLMEAYRNGI
jgi:hypothetical protein